jgi:hypothetical protein
VTFVELHPSNVAKQNFVVTHGETPQNQIKGVSVQCHYLKDKSVIKQIDRMENRIKREVLNT